MRVWEEMREIKSGEVGGVLRGELVKVRRNEEKVNRGKGEGGRGRGKGNVEKMR